MVQSVFVPIQETDVYLGNSMMDRSAFTSRIHAQSEQDGMARCAPRLAETVPMDSTKKALNADHSLKDVFPQRPGTMANVWQREVNVHSALSQVEAAVNHRVDVKADRLGTVTCYNACVPEEQDGVEENVLSVQADKSGICTKDALVLRDSSWRAQDARDQSLECAN